MEANQSSKLISEIIGMPLWEISIGPSGINIHLGKQLESHFMKIPIMQGEISLWCECNTRIYRDKVGGEIITDSLYPQDKNEEGLFRQYFENKIVADAFIREKDQSLHILVEPNIIFSAYPWTKESEKCWIIYDHRIKNPKGIMVYSDGIEVSE